MRNNPTNSLDPTGTVTLERLVVVGKRSVGRALAILQGIKKARDIINPPGYKTVGDGVPTQMTEFQVGTPDATSAVEKARRFYEEGPEKNREIKGYLFHLRVEFAEEDPIINDDLGEANVWNVLPTREARLHDKIPAYAVSGWSVKLSRTKRPWYLPNKTSVSLRALRNWVRHERSGLKHPGPEGLGRALRIETRDDQCGLDTELGNSAEVAMRYKFGVRAVPTDSALDYDPSHGWGPKEAMIEAEEDWQTVGKYKVADE